MPLAFDARLFQASLRTELVGRFLVYRDSVETTMTIARREAAEGAPHGTLVLAEEQTAGRGRKGRSFHSPKGENLYFTLLLRTQPIVHRRLPLVVPVAVCHAVRDEGVEAEIKWPNDIWVGMRKLCGMLIDAELGPEGPIAYPGIGINVNGDPTVIPELRDTATSIRREVGRPVQREVMLAAICNQLEALLELAEDPLVQRYRSMSMVLERSVVVTPSGGDAPFEATAVSIADDGSLVVSRADGSTETVTAADVSLRPA